MLLMPGIVLFGVVFENLVMIGITALLDTGVTIPDSTVGVIIGQAVWAFFTGPVLIVVIKYVDDRYDKFVSSREKEFA